MNTDRAGSPGADHWQVRRRRGSAAELHGADLGWDRALWVLSVDAPAVVLGSTQDPGMVDAARAETAGVEVARRRSGGGVVWLDDSAVWIDATIGRADPLWVDDVSRSALWLGSAWVDALGALGLEGLSVAGPEASGSAPSAVCFGSIFPGEVLDASGRKIVGISQRRSREGARFQCVAYHRWNPEPMARCLADPDPALALAGGAVGTVPADSESLAVALSRILAARPRDGGV